MAARFPQIARRALKVFTFLVACWSGYLGYLSFKTYTTQEKAQALDEFITQRLKEANGSYPIPTSIYQLRFTIDSSQQKRPQDYIGLLTILEDSLSKWDEKIQISAKSKEDSVEIAYLIKSYNWKHVVVDTSRTLAGFTFTGSSVGEYLPKINETFMSNNLKFDLSINNMLATYDPNYDQGFLVEAYSKVNYELTKTGTQEKTYFISWDGAGRISVDAFGGIETWGGSYWFDTYHSFIFLIISLAVVFFLYREYGQDIGNEDLVESMKLWGVGSSFVSITPFAFRFFEVEYFALMEDYKIIGLVSFLCVASFGTSKFMHYLSGRVARRKQMTTNPDEFESLDNECQLWIQRSSFCVYMGGTSVFFYSLQALYIITGL